MVGTVKRTSQSFRLHWCRPEGERYSSKLAFSDTHSLVSYVPKKNRSVILMSTQHKDYAVSTTEGRKLHIIQDFNRSKGGVDCLDNVMYIFTCHAFCLTFIHGKHGIIVSNLLFIISFLAAYWYVHVQANDSTLASGGIPHIPDGSAYNAYVVWMVLDCKHQSEGGETNIVQELKC